MKLISSADALKFLTKAAPRPWVKIMLKSLIRDDALTPYFAQASIKTYREAIDILTDIDGFVQMQSDVEREAAIRANYDATLADRLIGANYEDMIFEPFLELGESKEMMTVGASYFAFADHLDWEGGLAHVNIEGDLPEEDLGRFWIGPEHYEAIFDPADEGGVNYSVSLSGMSFSYDAIELLLPSVEFDTIGQVRVVYQESKIGRPRKWDWEAAMASIIAVAQHPDGLPTGPGAQARIEELLADWFTREMGDAPATSQIRKRASQIILLVEKKPNAF